MQIEEPDSSSDFSQILPVRGSLKNGSNASKVSLLPQLEPLEPLETKVFKRANTVQNMGVSRHSSKSNTRYSAYKRLDFDCKFKLFGDAPSLGFAAYYKKDHDFQLENGERAVFFMNCIIINIA